MLFSNDVMQSGVDNGIPLEDKSVINLLLSILGLGFVSMALIQADLNKVARTFKCASIQE